VVSDYHFTGSLDVVLSGPLSPGGGSTGHDAVPSVAADVGALLAIGGAFLATFGWLTGRHALLPVGDPRLAESMAFENV